MRELAFGQEDAEQRHCTHGRRAAVGGVIFIMFLIKTLGEGGRVEERERKRMEGGGK